MRKMHLKAALSKLALRFVDHLFGVILGLLTVAALAVWGTFFWTSAKRILNYAIVLLNIPTPLWVTTVLVLLATACIYLRWRSNPQPTSEKPRIDFIANGDLKWKVAIYENGFYKIEDAPYCVIHDLKLHHFKGGYSCYHIGRNNCNSRLGDSDYNLRKTCIDSLAEQHFRNKGTR